MQCENKYSTSKLVKLLRFGLALLFASGTEVGSTTKAGIVVIPGLGRPDRLTTVVENIRSLDSFLGGDSPVWDCVIYIYARHDDLLFWDNRAQLEYLSAKCELIENPGKMVTDNLYMMQPALLRRSYSHIFILLDDCKLLGESTFPLGRMMNIMKINNLTVASPMVISANVGGGQEFRTIMQREALPGTAGYVSIFVELFAWVMDMNAYKALWELLYPSVNPYGWGYDFWYNNYAGSRVPGHRMGIVSVVKVKHQQGSEGRTDNTAVKVKWAAVEEQERVYKSHLGINLKLCRKNLNLRNSSWNGAVTAFLIDDHGEDTVGEIKLESTEVLDVASGKRRRKKNRKIDGFKV